MEDFLYIIVVFFAGIVTALVSIWFLLISEENSLPIPSIRKKSIKDMRLPESITDSIKNQETFNKRETCLSLNLILQFFFQEKQHDIEVRMWLTELISQEFYDLLKHRALSKIINKMEIQDLNLGHNFPVINAATPVMIEYVKNSTLLKKVEINVEIEYTGGFQLAVDAITKLSQKAVVKIKVVRLSGKGCLEFNRYPYTHWSFSFYEEPEVEFEVVSTVLGHHIPRFRSIIINQLKLLINKKHTLPNYKLRGPPLVSRKRILADENYLSAKGDGTDISGCLFVTLVKCTRLQTQLIGTALYFSVTLSEAPLICAYETPVGIWVTLEITVVRHQNTSLGILLRTADDNSQIIETVSIKSPAYQAGLRKNDIVLAVNDVCLVSGSQAARLFSLSSYDSSKNRIGLDSQEMTVRIKRLVYTDHKRSSVECKNLFEPSNFSGETDSIYSLSSSQSAPLFLDSDISVDGSSLIEDVADKSKASRPISIQGDKVTFSLNQNTDETELDFISLSTPESSCSNSPELKNKYLNLSAVASDLSPIHSCDEEPSKATDADCIISSGVSLGEEKIPEFSSSPIQIPYNIFKSISSRNNMEKQSVSSRSSRAGTPTSETYEFVPQMVPPGMPIVKMDIKNMSKKVACKNRIVLKHFETAPVEGSCEPILGNDFEFCVDEESKYVNVCVWSKNLPLEIHRTASVGAKEEKSSSAKEVINKFRSKDTKEIFKESEKKSLKDLKRSCIENHTSLTGHPDHVLVGYANLYIEDIISETTLNTQGYVTKIINLLPANPNCPELFDHPLLSHAGFDPKLCYGDVMLAVTHQPKNKLFFSNKTLDRSSSNIPISEDDSPTDTTQSDEEDRESNQDRKEERDHDFKRTHFNTATHCNFCKKKIWLKDAYQCSECGIICHKKCMLRCEQATVCDFGGLRYREIRDHSMKIDSKTEEECFKDMPEIITTADGDSPVTKDLKKSTPATPLSPRHTMGSFLSHISVTSSVLKRTGSAHYLAPQGSSEFGFSRSLPPSPKHTPQSSRKVSLSGNPFLTEDNTEENHLEATLKLLLIFPHNEKLLAMARESAPFLYSNLNHQERLDRIKRELEILQQRVDNEGETRKDLALQEKKTSDKTDPLKRTKLSLLISECDARTQALALLTLHYFTALRQVQEVCSDKTPDS